MTSTLSWQVCQTFLIFLSTWVAHGVVASTACWPSGAGQAPSTTCDIWQHAGQGSCTAHVSFVPNVTTTSFVKTDDLLYLSGETIWPTSFRSTVFVSDMGNNGHARYCISCGFSGHSSDRHIRSGNTDSARDRTRTCLISGKEWYLGVHTREHAYASSVSRVTSVDACVGDDDNDDEGHVQFSVVDDGSLAQWYGEVLVPITVVGSGSLVIGYGEVLVQIHDDGRGSLDTGYGEVLVQITVVGRGSLDSWYGEVLVQNLDVGHGSLDI